MIRNKFLYEEEIQENILNLLIRGETILLGIKLISLMKTNLIDLKFCTKVLKNFKIVFLNYKESTCLLNCYNPIFAISLTAEILDKFRTQFHVLEISCVNLKNNILEFGNLIIDKMLDEDIYLKLMNEEDFEKRTTIDLICINRQTQLLKDEKSENIFETLNYGPEGRENLVGIDSLSILHHLGILIFILAWDSIIVEGQKRLLTSIFINFNLTNEYKFIFQHKYRRYASSFYFWYELIMTFLCLILFQHINIHFFFMNFKIDNVPFSIGFVHFTLFMNITIMLGGLFKLIYNSVSKFQIEWDLWKFFDFILAILNIMDVSFILSTRGVINDLDRNYINFLKYFISLVLILNWMRLALFFLCFKISACLIQTLVFMIYETIYFLVIFICYLLIVATIFFLVFQKVQSFDLKDIYSSLFWLYDATVGTFYHPDNLGDYDLVHRFLLAVHVLASNILLLNYLVAILSTVYNLLNKEEDIRLFACRSYIHYYSKRLSNAMIDKKYGDFILIMPPFNILLFLTTLFLPWPNLFDSVINGARLIYFTIVSFIASVILGCYLILISPVVYIKVFFLYYFTNNPLYIKVIYSSLWALFGYIRIIYEIINDLKNFVFGLTINYSLDKNVEESEIGERQLIYKEIFNEMRNVIKDLNEILETKLGLTNRILITTRGLIELITKLDVENRIENKILIKNQHHGTLKKKNIYSIELLKMFLEKYLKCKILKLHHYNNERNIIIDLKIKPRRNLVDRKNKIAPFINSFIKCFVMNEFFGTVVDIKSINAILNKNLKISSIEKIFMINYGVIIDARKEQRNKDNYGICEHFDNVNHSRYSKMKNKIEYLNKMAHKIVELTSEKTKENSNNIETVSSTSSDDNY